MRSLSKLDPVLILLFMGIMVFTVILLFCEYFFKTDGQIFQVISGIVTGFAGAFFGRMKPTTDHPDQASSTSSTTVSTTVAVPVPDPPKL